MKLTDFTGEPFNASINGVPPATVKQHLETYKVTDDDSMKELAEVMHKGRDIVMQVQVGDCAYVMVRELVPSKLSIPMSPSNDESAPIKLPKGMGRK